MQMAESIRSELNQTTDFSEVIAKIDNETETTKQERRFMRALSATIGIFYTPLQISNVSEICKQGLSGV